MKKVLSLMLCSVLFLLMTGCASSKNDSSDNPTNVPEPTSATAGTTEPTAATEAPLYDKPVTMQLTIWGNDAQKQLYDELMAEYSEINPNVTGEVVIVPWSDYQQKMAIMLSGQQAPDVAWLADTMIPQFLEGGKLTDISPLKDDPDYDFADITPGSFGPLTLDGVPYGVAFSNPPAILWWNKTMFKEHGLEDPNDLYAKGEWTFGKFLEYAKELTDVSKGKYGALLANGGSAWTMTYSFVNGFGGDYFDSTGAFTYDNDAAKQGLQMYMDMLYKDQVVPMPGDQLTFDSGSIGMYKMTLAYASTAKNITDFEYDIAPLPLGPETTTVEAGFAGYVVFKDEDAQKTAQRLDLLKFLTSKEAMFKTGQYYVPPRKSVLESPDYSQSLSLPDLDHFQTVVVDRVAQFRTYPGHKNWVQINTEMQSIFDELLMKSVDVDTAIAEIKERVVPLAQE